MVSNLHLPLITKASRKLYVNAQTPPNSLKNLRYIPDWFIPKETCGNYNDFMLQMQKHYPNISTKKFIKTVQKEKNKIGEGREAKVYKIPKINNYVMRVKREPKTSKIFSTKKFRPAQNYYYGINLGQPIADNHNGITINVRAHGEEYGIPNWINCMYRRAYPSERSANAFVNYDLAQLSEFPLESFYDFIKKVSFIKNATPHTFDFINPNNFIIDYKNKKINIVDTAFKTNDNFHNANINRIPSTLCDEGVLFYAGFDALEKAENYVHKIKTKTRIAIDSYENSYPKIKWQEPEKPTQNTLTVTESVQDKIKKIIHKIRQKVNAKIMGKYIESLNNN